MESLLASAILFAGVLAVVSAIMTGQSQALDAQLRMEAAMTAEDLMAEIASMDYWDLDLLPPIQPAGKFLVLITRNTGHQEDLSDLGILVEGTLVHVQILPGTGESTILAQLELFIPEPQP